MEKHVQNSSPLASLNELEDLVLDIQNDLLYTWTKSWKQKDASLYQERLLANGLHWSQESQVETTTEGIEEHQWTPNAGTDSANTYLSQFSQIDSLQISVLEAKQIEKNVELELFNFVITTAIASTIEHCVSPLPMPTKMDDSIHYIRKYGAFMIRAPIFTDATAIGTR